MNLANEELFRLTKASQRFADPPHVCTVVRWALKGLGPQKIKLETVKIGGRRYTSHEAIIRFIARLNAQAPASRAFAESRERQVQLAQHELEAEGF